jgi:hypothetical protein
MAVDQNFAAFGANLAELAPDVDFKAGNQELSSAGAPPLVTMAVRPEEDILGRMGFGGKGSFGSQNPEMFATRKVYWDAYIWGEDRDDCERILGHVVVAIWNAGWGAVDFSKGRWVADEQLTKAGNLYVLSGFMLIPITREISNVGKMATIPIQIHDPISS